MATKKSDTTTAKETAVEETTSKAAGQTAEEELEYQQTEDELLEDMPALRAPERLRVRHRNRIMGAFLKAERTGVLDKLGRTDEDVDTQALMPMMDLIADIDDFAESIAEDKEAYVEWAEKNSDNYDVFIAIMNRYVSAVGE